MKNNNLGFIEALLKVYVLVGFFGGVIGVLIIQTQISVLNLELSSNLQHLDDLEANNAYLEMQKNESLTREKMQVFADANGLLTAYPNVVDLDSEE